MKFRNLLLLQLIFLVFFAVFSEKNYAQLQIEIIGGGAKRIPIAILPLTGENQLPQNLSDIVKADLENSGLFRAIDVSNIFPLPTESSAINYGEWASRSADALVLGSVTKLSDGRMEVRFRLFDTVKQVSIGGVAYTITPALTRATAHRISDYVYEKLTGGRGIFSTRIAFVVKKGPRFELQIADADGNGAQAALISREPIISAAWSPDASKIAYVSFENKKPILYIHSLATGQRQVLANFKGSNSAPAWAPDGNQLAVVLSKDGNPQIYILNADGTNLKRLTYSQGIDTEPFFSPDGKFIYFTSDRGGTPQIYRMPANGGEAVRITFEGSYNVSPRVSPDGKTLVYVSRNEMRFQVTVMDLETKQIQIITDTIQDESPSFAPNGKIIIYATEINGRGVLSTVSTDGRIKQRLSQQASDVREPTWGPFSNN